jgi:hypothetical protein
VAREYRDSDPWTEDGTRTSLKRGFLLGLYMATGMSCVAIARIALAVAGFSFFGHSPAIGEVGAVGWLLVWVIPGYFVGFGIAGVLLAIASHLGNRVIRYTLSGFFCSSIYGAVGISSDLADGKTPDLADVATTVAILGLAFAAVGFVLGVLDSIRARRRTTRAAG